MATGIPRSAAAVTVTSAGNGCADDSSRIIELARVASLLRFPGQLLGTPTLFIDGVVHRGGYDPPALLAALARWR